MSPVHSKHSGIFLHVNQEINDYFLLYERRDLSFHGVITKSQTVIFFMLKELKKFSSAEQTVIAVYGNLSIARGVEIARNLDIDAGFSVQRFVFNRFLISIQYMNCVV